MARNRSYSISLREAFLDPGREGRNLCLPGRGVVLLEPAEELLEHCVELWAWRIPPDYRVAEPEKRLRIFISHTDDGSSAREWPAHLADTGGVCFDERAEAAERRVLLFVVTDLVQRLAPRLREVTEVRCHEARVHEPNAPDRHRSVLV